MRDIELYRAVLGLAPPVDGDGPGREGAAGRRSSRRGRNSPYSFTAITDRPFPSSAHSSILRPALGKKLLIASGDRNRTCLG